MTRRIKWWAVIALAASIIGADRDPLFTEDRRPDGVRSLNKETGGPAKH